MLTGMLPNAPPQKIRSEVKDCDLIKKTTRCDRNLVNQSESKPVMRLKISVLIFKKRLLNFRMISRLNNKLR